MINTLTATSAYSTLGVVCPVAPPGAQEALETIMGYAVWAVIVFFAAATLISIAMLVIGKTLGMRALVGAGGVGLAVVFVAVILYLSLPSILDGMLGSGCFG